MDSIALPPLPVTGVSHMSPPALPITVVGTILALLYVDGLRWRDCGIIFAHRTDRGQLKHTTAMETRLSPDEIFNVLTADDESRKTILYCAKRDNEKPLGVIVTWITERFGYARTDAYPIAEKIRDFWGLARNLPSDINVKLS